MTFFFFTQFFLLIFLVSPSFSLTHSQMALSNYCLCVWFLDWQFLRVFFFKIIFFIIVIALKPWFSFMAKTICKIKKEKKKFCFCFFIMIIIIFCVLMFVWYVSNCIWMIFLAIDMSSYYNGSNEIIFKKYYFNDIYLVRIIE